MLHLVHIRHSKTYSFPRVPSIISVHAQEPRGSIKKTRKLYKGTKDWRELYTTYNQVQTVSSVAVEKGREGERAGVLQGGFLEEQGLSRSEGD